MPKVKTTVVVDDAESSQKKRRIPGACDICKRKKIRCDSGEMPDNRCSNCLQAGLECSHKEVTKTLGPAKGYVESLEARLEKMDRLLSQLLPGVDIAAEMDQLQPSLQANPPIADSNDLPPSPSEMLTIKLERLNLAPQSHRFFGKSSGHQLVQTALDLKEEVTGDKASMKSAVPLKRREFWTVPPWAKIDPGTSEPVPNYTYPDDDLMPSLIDAYFTQINYFLPLLHRPTFERHVAEGLHYEDGMFASVLLLVCSHGARFSDDPRVFPPGTTCPRSAGWIWFKQVKVLRRNLYHRATLYELQMHVLHVCFGHASESPEGVWSQIGLAVRLSQEVGAHRRRRKKDTPPSVEDELWKRAFWAVLSLDRILSSQTGRPCALHEEDYDLDLPIECDDEYWETGFQQPEGKPSSVAYFNMHLKLTDILAYAMRLIYHIKKPDNVFGKAIPRSETQIIFELDKSMNGWMDSVPGHLKWNTYRTDEIFIKQSAALYATYYYLQMFVHRSFILSPRRNQGPVTYPSLAICTNAARSCCHVLEAYTKHGPIPLNSLMICAFSSAVILLLNIWSGRRSGIIPNPKREMEDVTRILEILRKSESRWAVAGRYRDILSELASAGHMDLPKTPERNAQGAERQSTTQDDVASPPFGSLLVTSSLPEGQEPAGYAQFEQSNPTSNQTQPPINALKTAPSPTLNFTLPMYGTELSQLPIYGYFGFLDAAAPTQQPNPPSVVSPPTASSLDEFQLFLANLSAGPPSSRMSFDQRISQGVPFSGSSTNTQGPTQPQDTDDYLNTLYQNSQAFLGNLFNTTFSAQIPAADSSATSTSPSQAAVPPGIPMYATSSSADALPSEPTFGVTNQMNEQFRFDNGDVLMESTMDTDMMTMWRTAPTGFEMDEWNTFLSSVEQITQAQPPGLLSRPSA